MKKIYAAASICILILVCMFPIAAHEEHKLYLAPHHHLWFALSLLWSLGTVCAIVLVIVIKKRYNRLNIRVLIPLIILVDILVMFIMPELSAPRSTIVDLAPVNYMKQNLGNSRFYSLGYIMPNYGSYFGIASINTNNMPVAENWTKYLTKHLNPNVNPSQQFTGVDELSAQGVTPTQAFLENLNSYEEVGVKYVVVPDGTLTTDQTSASRLLNIYSDGNFTIYQLPNPKPYFQATEGSCKTTETASRSNITIKCIKPGTLLRRELYMPGWTATVNGKPAKISQRGPLFQSIKLPKGKDNVYFNFTPPHMRIGYLAFAVGVISIGYLAYDIRTSEKPKPKYAKVVAAKTKPKKKA